MRDAHDPSSTPARPARRVLWYWPFARPEEIQLAAAFADGDDMLTVQVLDREAAPEAGAHGRATIVRDLPEVDRDQRGVRWVFSRLATYATRARRRSARLRREQPDLVHYFFLNRFTDLWRRPPGRWVISVHDVEPHQPRLGRLEHLLLARLHRRADGVVVHHRWLAEKLEREHGVDPDRIVVVPLQVAPVADPSERPQAERPRILCFGAIRANKGLAEAIEMMDDPALAGHDLHIAGRGDRDLEHRLTELAASRPNVTVEIGLVTTERKDELFRSASVVVLPYLTFSSQSGVLHDAYGHGRPVVTTDVGALGATVRADGTGRVVDDRSAMVDAIVEMAGPAGDAPARAARQIATDRTPERIAEELREAYRVFGA